MVSQSIIAAQEAAKEAIESTYDGVVTITEHEKVTDTATKLVSYADNVVVQNQACKLSFEKITAANQSDTAAPVTQVTKLFISSDITVKAGSKLTVTQAGITTDYKSSGVPAVYITHQEIILDLFERWA